MNQQLRFRLGDKFDRTEYCDQLYYRIRRYRISPIPSLYKPTLLFVFILYMLEIIPTDLRQPS